jgi:Leucine-rich repeat (LRR) protein
VQTEKKKAPLLKSCLVKPDSTLITKLLTEEQDDRYRYLLKNSVIHYVEQDNGTIYIELKQIPGVMVVYRRPFERVKNGEKIQLDDRGFSRLPLLEGEDKLKYLNLSNNSITKIENIVSLPNLTFLDLTGNRIKEITVHPTVKSLKVLILARNMIEEVKNLDSFSSLEIVDLHENRIRQMCLKSVAQAKVVNLSSNLIEVLEVGCPMPNLVELNLRRNQIADVKEFSLPELKKLYLSGNKISSLEAFTSLPSLTDLTLESNPVDKTPGFALVLKDKFPSLINYNLQKIPELDKQDFATDQKKQK